MTRLLTKQCAHTKDSTSTLHPLDVRKSLQTSVDFAERKPSTTWVLQDLNARTLDLNHQLIVIAWLRTGCATHHYNPISSIDNLTVKQMLS